MGVLDLFIPLQTSLELAKKHIAEKDKRSWDQYAREHNTWLYSVCNENLDQDGIEYIQKYCGDHPSFNLYSKTPPIIEMIFKEFPSYKKELPYYPIGRLGFSKKRDRENRNVEICRVLLRIKMLEYNLIPVHDAMYGIKTEDYFPYTDISYRQIMHDFLRWYDSQLRDIWPDCQMLFLSSNYFLYPVEQRTGLCVPVSQMEKWDRGIYFWYQNRHVAGLITKPNYK